MQAQNLLKQVQIPMEVEGPPSKYPALDRPTNGPPQSSLGRYMQSQIPPRPGQGPSLSAQSQGLLRTQGSSQSSQGSSLSAQSQGYSRMQGSSMANQGPSFSTQSQSLSRTQGPSVLSQGPSLSAQSQGLARTQGPQMPNQGPSLSAQSQGLTRAQGPSMLSQGPSLSTQSQGLARGQGPSASSQGTSLSAQSQGLHRTQGPSIPGQGSLMQSMGPATSVQGTSLSSQTSNRPTSQDSTVKDLAGRPTYAPAPTRQTTIPKNKTAEFVKKEAKDIMQVEVECVAPYEDADWIPLGRTKDGVRPEEVQYATMLSPPHHKTSFLRLSPAAQKGLAATDKNTLLFLVTEGEVTVILSASQFVVSRGDSFFVPPHNTYNLMNFSSVRAELFLVQYRHQGSFQGDQNTSGV